MAGDKRTLGYMDGSREPLHIVRILVSDRNELVTDFLAELVHEIARLGINVATIIPPTIREADLLETAAKQTFDAAVLTLNNIFYSPYDMATRAQTLAEDSLALVRKMVILFKKPIIALYGSPDDLSYPSRIIEAGATAVFRLPFSSEEFQQALKRCLSIW